MEPRFAFTAQYWGNGAVVCRAVEDRPGPVVEQQFGEFETWTQARNFAAKLNEGLDLDPFEARQIVTSSFLGTACVVQEALNFTSSSCSSSTKGIEAAARAAQLRCMLSELALSLTLCRSATRLSERAVLRIVAHARRVLDRSEVFLRSFDADARELQDIVERTQELNSTFQDIVSCLPILIPWKLVK